MSDREQSNCAALPLLPLRGQLLPPEIVCDAVPANFCGQLLLLVHVSHPSAVLPPLSLAIIMTQLSPAKVSGTKQASLQLKIRRQGRYLLSRTTSTERTTQTEA